MNVCVCVFVCTICVQVRQIESLIGMYTGYVLYVCAVTCLCEHVCVCSGQSERGNVVKDFCGIFNVCY